MPKKTNVRLFLIAVALLLALPSYSQKKSKDRSKEAPPTTLNTTPKLMVGIVVDQMRYDYLTRFWDHYGNGGFKRLVEEGFNCKNNHFNYAPTSTAPGHASVFTGSAPGTHGIIGNDWYDKTSGTSVYCVSDTTYRSIGTTSNTGKMSPHRLLVTTITDELRLHSQMRGKTISVALKDRGAVLPGGHTANAAYWFNGRTDGNWISSSYYMNTLPKWVDDFNGSNAAAMYKKPWTALKDMNSYLQSGLDNNTYEGLFEGEATPTFPHDLPQLWDANGKYEMIRATPYGNSLTTDFAIAALEGEQLGEDMDTDFLTVSFSSTDYVGHKYGVNSKEVQDTYMRLDADLERLLKAFDKKVGKGEYTVFLTADHGAGDVPAYLKDQKIPAGYMTWETIKSELDQFLEFTYGTTEIIKNFSNNQYFLDHDIINNLDMELGDVEEAIALELIKYDGIQEVYTARQMWLNDYAKGIPYLLQNGYNQKRSGDIFVVLTTGMTNYGETGSTHGSPQIYDTHVPLLFFGKGIKIGGTVTRTEIPDIAPTISSLLGIAFPSGATGTPIGEVLETESQN